MSKLTAEQLQTALVIASMEYYKKYVQGDDEGASKLESAKAELAVLEKAGLGATRNARILKDIINRNDPVAGVRVEADTIVKTLTKVKEVYPKALVVPFDDFFKVLKQYNLACGHIGDYTGVIPEENVLQIAEATEAFKNLKFGEMCLIKQLRINSDMPKPLVKQLVEYFSRFPFTYGHITQGWDYMRAIGQKEHQDDLIFRSCRYVTDRDWFIAAPVADVPENVRIELYSKAEEDRRRRLEDPIVFKITPAGVVIVSMWGEEAKAEIFDKYR
jgi:hypothetical protein